MVAAPQSGSGKTTITCALLWALKARGLKPESFKCGPDYIDPMFHRTVLGIKSGNLDPFFMEDQMARQLLGRGEESRDLAVIEGVMGLYDGLGGIREEASSYALAKATGTPVLLTVNARGMGRSLLALLAGFLQYDTAHLIRGVILNQTSASFAAVLGREIEAAFGIPVVASFPVCSELKLESRHLGLVLPEEQKDLRQKIEKAAELLAEHADLDAILSIAETAKAISGVEAMRISKWETAQISGQKQKNELPVRIGVARDEAFCFYYKENLKMLEEAGARLEFFSPVHDHKLPDGLDGILLGGGYPELHLKDLADNESMRSAIRDALQAGMPSLAECGGFMYLHDEIQDQEGNRFPMAGVIHAACSRQEKLVRFGYLTLTSKTESFLLPGETIRGHEFHYYDSTDNGNAAQAEKPTGKRSWECVHAGPAYWWGFAHLSYCSNPQFAVRFVSCCRSYREQLVR